MLTTTGEPVPVSAAEPPGSRRLRIAMVAACPFPLRRGTPVRIFRIAEALGQRGHDVHVVTYHLGDEAPAVPFRIHRIPPVRSYRKLSPGPSYRKLVVLDPLLRRTLGRVLRGQAFDLIHAHHFEGLLVALSLPRRERPPIVFDAHTLLGSELPYYSLGLSTRLKQRIGAWLDRALPGRAAHVIGVTDELRDQLLAIGAVGADRVSVIGSGVELELFDVPPLAPPTGTTVVFAGNLAAYQGVEHLLHAFQAVGRRRPEARLQIITESEFRPYDALARSLGIRDRIEIVNAGFDRLPAYLRAADVAVNPRVYCTGIPQKLMNYMAAGCPIVSFAGSAAHLRHGSTGWVVPDGDITAMADGILALLDDRPLAQRLGAAAREQIARDYSWLRIAEQVEAVYGRVLSPSTHGSPEPFGSNGSRGWVTQGTGTWHPADAAPGRPVRVLFLYDHLGYPGGATHGLTRYCLDVLPRLDSGPVEMFACFLREPHPAGEALRRAGVAPIFLNRAKWDPHALLDVLRIIRRHRIEIVHAAGQKGILIGCTAARLSGCGDIIHLRDVYPLGPVLRPLMRAAVRGVDVALGVSEAACRHAVREYGIPESRTELLYNGIALDGFRPPDPAHVVAWRARMRIPSSARTIGVIGRLAPVKGHARLLRQLPALLRRVPGVVLVVVGDGPLRPQLEALAASLGVEHAVRFAGQQDDIPAVLGALDVVAIPSEHEGLCHVALEALAVGRPVVASDVGGLPEALGRGAHGVLVPPHDEDALREALVRVLEDPALTVGLLRNVGEHLQWFALERHVERQREIYLHLAAGLRARRSGRASGVAVGP